MPKKTDPDKPVIDARDDHPGWAKACPKCLAKPDEECTSLVSGCCLIGMHAERAEKAKAATL